MYDWKPRERMLVEFLQQKDVNKGVIVICESSTAASKHESKGTRAMFSGCAFKKSMISCDLDLPPQPQ